MAVRFLEDLFRRQNHIDSLYQNSDFLELDPRNRRLVTELVYGVLRNRQLLDYYLGELSRTALERLDETVLWILRVAIYQVEFLRVPNHAAVHEAVESCRGLHKTSAGGFVNAILRSFLRNSPKLPEGRSASALAVHFSHPEWLVERYLTRYGVDQTENLLRRNNEPPTPVLWVNVFKTDLQSLCRELEEDQISYQVHSQLPNCLIMRSPAFTEHRAYREGRCFVMDAASQEVAYLSELKDRQMLGDFCCAPGGKSFLLASQKAKGAKLYCCDSSFRRLRETGNRAKFLQIPDLNLINADLRFTAPFLKVFDFLLLDVPCSGLGTLRSNPDIRWKVRERDLDRFHSLQVTLLRNGFSVLHPGGELTYSTCSTEPEENEGVIRDFLSQEKKALLVGDFHRTLPNPYLGDCFFAARIRQVGS